MRNLQIRQTRLLYPHAMYDMYKSKDSLGHLSQSQIID